MPINFEKLAKETVTAFKTELLQNNNYNSEEIESIITKHLDSAFAKLKFAERNRLYRKFTPYFHPDKPEKNDRDLINYLQNHDEANLPQLLLKEYTNTNLMRNIIINPDEKIDNFFKVIIKFFNLLGMVNTLLQKHEQYYQPFRDLVTITLNLIIVVIFLVYIAVALAFGMLYLIQYILNKMADFTIFIINSITDNQFNLDIEELINDEINVAQAEKNYYGSYYVLITKIGVPVLNWVLGCNEANEEKQEDEENKAGLAQIKILLKSIKKINYEEFKNVFPNLYNEFKILLLFFQTDDHKSNNEEVIESIKNNINNLIKDKDYFDKIFFVAKVFYHAIKKPLPNTGLINQFFAILIKIGQIFIAPIFLLIISIVELFKFINYAFRVTIIYAPIILVAGILVILNLPLFALDAVRAFISTIKSFTEAKEDTATDVANPGKNSSSFFYNNFCANQYPDVENFATDIAWNTLD